MSDYTPGAHIARAGWAGPRHYSPSESWKDRDRRAEKRRERRERARRTVTRKQGPPEGGNDDEKL